MTRPLRLGALFSRSMTGRRAIPDDVRATALVDAQEATGLQRTADGLYAAYQKLLERRTRAWDRAMRLGLSARELAKMAEVRPSTVQRAVDKLREKRAA